MTQPTVFVSHASEDATFAHKLANDLKSVGVNVWIDTADMEPGSIIEQMNSALRRDLLILVLTPDAVRSSWVSREMGAAINRAKDGFMREPIIIVAKPFESRDVPPLWGTYLRYDATKNYAVALAQVIHQIDRAEDAPATAIQPAPQAPAGAQSRVVVELEKGQAARIELSKVRIELYWGVSTEAISAGAMTNQEFDVDYALFICRRATSDPKASYVYAARDIIYWPGPEHPEQYENRHIFPYGSALETAAIIRSKDERFGGRTSTPDETGIIDFSRLPADVVRIVVYIHIYKGSTRRLVLNGQSTQQLFKHANVRFYMVDDADGSPLVSINLGHKYPDNWGVALCEFIRTPQGAWEIVSIERPLDGDTVKACLDDYHLAAPGIDIRL